MPPVLSVSQCNQTIDALLREAFPTLQVRGEVSEYKIAQGKFAYFTLKDSSSAVSCFAMAYHLDWIPSVGDEVVVTATPGIHLKSGRYSLTVSNLTLHGEGALQKAIEELKRKLEGEGLFDVRHKRPLPRFPESIGIITSDSGAAIGDIVKVINGRWGGVSLKLIPAKVQGDEAAGELVSAIESFNRRLDVDVIIFGRGGGSVEDLAAFNTERVARAIFASRIPIISAVGHEHNVSISDLVADIRAATPSNAAELAVPDRRQIAALVASFQSQWHRLVKQAILGQSARLAEHIAVLERDITLQVNSVKQLIAACVGSRARLTQNITYAQERLAHNQLALKRSAALSVESWRQRIRTATSLLATLSPHATLRRGYTITTATGTGRPITSVAGIPRDGRMTTRFADGSRDSVVIRRPAKPAINHSHQLQLPS